MTYQEIKDRLSKCEYTLNKLKDSTSKGKDTKTIAKLEILKESLQKKLNEAEDGVIFTDDERKAKELAKDGARVKLTKEEEEVEKLSKKEVSLIAKEAGKAVVQVIQQSGDEVSRAKVKDVYASALSGDSSPEAFTVHIIYKNDSEVSYRFQIINNVLYYLADNKDVKLSDVGIKPSGEPLLNTELIKNEMSKYFKKISEMTDQEFADAKEAERLANHPDKDKIIAIQNLIAKEKGLKEDEYDDMVASDNDIPDDKKKGAAKALRMVDKGASYDKVKKHLKEAPHQTTYIKVSKNDYKKAIQIIDQNIDREYVNTDIVDDDGDGNVIVYFNFTPATTDHDRYNPDSDPAEFIYDLSMDLLANDISIVDKSHDLDEANLNDPVLMKLRALKSKIGKNKEKQIAIPPKKLAILSKLQTKRSEVLRDMEQEAEPEGGPIADKYGDMLNKIDAAIAKAKGRKEMDYDTAVGKVNDGYNDRDDVFTFGYNLDMIQAVVDHLKSNYSEDDYELHIGRGDTHPNAVTLKNPKMNNDKELGNLLIAAEDQEETDYQSNRELEKDYMEEDKDIGHQDNEPNMLKSSAFETAQYAAKLVKKLNRYDKHDGEVDFPNWWQKKLILARDYMSAAFHYLDSEEKQPAIDQLALENKDVSEYSSGPWTKHKLLAYLGQADDAMIRTHDDKYLIIYNPKNGNDDNAAMWNDDSVFAVDQDGEEHEVSYDNIDGLQLENMEENSEIDKIIKAKRLIKQQAPAMNKLPQDDPKRKAFIQKVKLINQKHKELLDKEDDKVSGIGKDQELSEGRGDFDDVLKAIENMSNNDDISERDAAAEIVLALADKFQLPVDKNLEDYMEESVNEATDLYDRNGIQITRFSGGDRGLMLQINIGGKYIVVPADDFNNFIRALASIKDDVRDMKLQQPRDRYESNE